jgi:hypothetical protein
MPVSEAETNIAQLALFAAVVARDWEPLPEGVLRIIKRVGGKTAPGLLMVNQCWQRGLIELGLMPPDDTTILPKERAHRSICAPSINPAEGIHVDPYEAGLWFIRRAPDFATPTSSASEPAARAEASMSEPVPPAELKQPAPTPSSAQGEPKPPPKPAPTLPVEPPLKGVVNKIVWVVCVPTHQINYDCRAIFSVTLSIDKLRRASRPVAAAGRGP